MKNSLESLLGSMQLSNKNVEVANLPSSDVTKYASFLITVGLQHLAKDPEGVRISNNFGKQLGAILDTDALREYGIPAILYVNPKTPKIMQSRAAELKTIIRKKIANDIDVSQEELTYLRFAVGFMENPYKTDAVSKARRFASKVSSAYMRNFDKVVGKLGNNSLELTSSTNAKSVASLYDQLQESYEKLTGKKAKDGNLNIPVADLNAMRATSTIADANVKQYKAIKRKISLGYDLDFANLMASRPDPIPVAEAYSEMEKLGYRNQKLVKVSAKAPLLVGSEGGKIKYFTIDGLALSNSIPSDAVVNFSKTYDKKSGTGAYLAFKAPNANGVTRLYTEKHVVKSTEKKFNTAKKINKNIGSTIKKWERGLTNADPMAKMASTVALLIYYTGARVGARQNSAAAMSGEKTFGMISLRPRHVILKSNMIRLKYVGKKGGTQDHLIPVKDKTTKLLLKNLQAFKDGKTGDDLIFSAMKKGKLVTLTYGALNKYLVSTGYVGGAHKMRHVRGTNLILDLLKAKDWSPSAKAKSVSQQQKEADDFIITQIITPVTKLLGHKSGTGKDLWRTTIKSYINPEPLIEWYSSKGLRKPSWLPAKSESKE